MPLDTPAILSGISSKNGVVIAMDWGGVTGIIRGGGGKRVFVMSK